MRFNYANYLKKLDDPSEGKHSYADIQAWTTEYYRHLMRELEGRLEVEEEVLKKLQSEGQTTDIIVAISILDSSISLLKEILGKE